MLDFLAQNSITLRISPDSSLRTDFDSQYTPKLTYKGPYGLLLKSCWFGKVATRGSVCIGVVKREFWPRFATMVDEDIEINTFSYHSWSFEILIVPMRMKNND